MYGDTYGTATLLKALRGILETIIYDEDNGTVSEDTLEDCQQLLDGAYVVRERIWEQVHE